MAFAYNNQPILMNATVTTLVTWSNGPWIPQTPDSHRDPDFREKWEEEHDEEED